MATRKRKAKAKAKDNLSDHSWMLAQLKVAQDADHDNREAARDAALFISKRDGMWEPHWWDQNDGKPRYTFDETTPIIDQIESSIAKNDYTIRVKPAGGEASKDTAETYDGLVRHIQDISNADEIYKRSCRSTAIKGMDGWEVVYDYADGDTFDKDLLIKAIPSFIDHVWFGNHTEPDGSDAKMAWKLAGLTSDEFEAAYPDRSSSGSVSTDQTSNAYYHRHDLIMVGSFYYLRPNVRNLVLMTNGQVYEDNDEFTKVRDELEQMGFTVKQERKREVNELWIRHFDADGWIGDAQPTVFKNWIPLIPTYGNFDYLEDKVIYYGAVEKLIDPQRVLNYSLSREVEEGALAPRAKYWMTPEQALGHEKSLETMNTNSDPIQLYNVDPLAPGAPQQNGGAQINPGLRNISENMQGIMGRTQGMYSANMGENLNAQSGKAIEALQSRGDDGNNKYVEARKVAQRHTGRILVDAIPRVYKPGRQVRILGEDGVFDMQTIGQPVQDQQTGDVVILNDLTAGTYDVTCSSGASFQNRQGETVRALTEIGAVDPTIIQTGSDILAKNINSPGMDQIAERRRDQLFKAGQIPENQLTDEERAQLQQMAQQPPQEDPMMVAAKAEEAKAQADLVDAQTKQAVAQGKNQESAANVQIKTKELELSMQELGIKKFEAETDRYKADIDKATAMADIKGKGAQAAKLLAEAEAQDIENSAVESGLMGMIEKIKEGVLDGGG